MFVLLPVNAMAQEPAAIAKLAWRDWVVTQDAAPATFAILQNGELLGEAGIDISPDAPRPVASLSKAILAACVDSLVADGTLDWVATTDDVLGGAAGGPTVAELLNHSSGIAPDETQGDAALASATGDQTTVVAERALARPRGVPGEFFYNNENYAILGTMVSAVSGMPYVETCRARVLDPAAAGGNVAGPWAAHGAWGGWQMSAADYGRFLSSTLAVKAADVPRLQVGPDVYTQAGLLTRDTPDGPLYWAFGLLCWEDRANGAYVVSHPDGTTVVVTFTSCPDGDSLMALDAALFEAVRPVE